MATIYTWTEDDSVNIEEIDLQHQKMFAIINELYQAMLEKKSQAVIGGVLDQLLEYTGSHFSYEEKLMEKYDYPGLSEHKKLHADFAQKVLDSHKDHQEGKFIMSIKFMGFLKDWLVKHIRGTDKLYADFLNSEGVY